MRETTHCDWCLRRLAPEEWESATTDEQRDGYCWGPGDALCDEIHGEEWKRLQSVRPAAPADDTCDTCGRPLATDADEQATSPGEGEDLCWRESRPIIRCECGFEYAWPTIDAEEQVLRCRCGHLIRVRQALPPAAWGESPLEEDEGGTCTGEPVDWRARYLAEAEARVAAEGEADCLRSEAEDLREWQKQAVVEIVRHCCCDDGCDAFPADCAGPYGEENPISRRCEIAALVWSAEDKV